MRCGRFLIHSGSLRRSDSDRPFVELPVLLPPLELPRVAPPLNRYCILRDIARSTTRSVDTRSGSGEDAFNVRSAKFGVAEASSSAVTEDFDLLLDAGAAAVDFFRPNSAESV